MCYSYSHHRCSSHPLLRGSFLQHRETIAENHNYSRCREQLTLGRSDAVGASTTTQSLQPSLGKHRERTARARGPRHLLRPMCLLEMTGKHRPRYLNNMASQTKPERGQRQQTCCIYICMHMYTKYIPRCNNKRKRGQEFEGGSREELEEGRKWDK